MLKLKSKIFGLAAATALMACLCVPAFATDVNSADASTSVPVNITATATTFNVTVPTALPSTVDPTTGETTEADNAIITNNSTAPVYVSSITAERYGDWTLAGFDQDLRNMDVDANKIGISIAPVGGRANTPLGSGTVLKTVAESPQTQTLLNTKSAEWVLSAKDPQGALDELRINYDTKATPVSTTITNQHVANIIVVVSWFK